MVSVRCTIALTAISLVMLAVSCCEAQSHAVGPNMVSISTGRFQFGDDPKWAEVDFDDSDWEQISIPESWVERADPFSFRLSGWYRLRVDLPEDANSWNQLAVSVGVVSDAAEVFFNGIKIGGKGAMLPYADGFPHDALALDLPRELINYDQSNVIAVRVHRFILEGGIVEGPVAVGARSSLESLLNGRQTRAWYADGIVTCFLILVFAHSLLLFLAGVRESAYMWLVICTLLLVVGGVVESRLIHQSVGPSVVRRGIELWCWVLLPFASHRFLAAFYGNSISRASTVAQACIVVILLMIASVPLAFTLLMYIWTLYLFVLMIAWLRWGVRAIVARMPDAIPMGVGLAALSFSLVGETFGLPYAQRIAGQYPTAIALVVFFGCGMIALTQRFQRSRVRAQRATAAILSAHEEERKRLARELHDGVVQSLLAIQLNLQMLRGSPEVNEPVDPESLDRVVDEIRTASDELRRVSHDLRPEALERLELAEAITSHAKQLEERSDLKIDVEAEQLVVASHLKDNLYRIYQEALLNAVKHAAANRVTVKVSHAADRIVMQVQDNGRGFQIDNTSEGRFGVGLTTIRERAELLGGHATITSSTNGTCISIDVPVQSDP